MKSTRWMEASIILIALLTGGASAQQAPPIIPGPVAAILKEHVGRWRATGEMTAGGRTVKIDGTRECESIQIGAGVICRWHDTHSPDGKAHEYVEILGYDPDAGLLRSARVSETGLLSTVTLEVSGNAMVAHWQTGTGAQATAGRNQITVTPGGGWLQRFTLDTGGQRTVEMTIRHERIRP
jgi:hypothetical protein